MTRATIATIKKGDIILTGYRNQLDKTEVLGFASDSETPAFDTLRELQSQVADKETHYAIFRDVEGDFTWAAYRWNGRWRVGSSADCLQIRPLS